jgi:transcriptional regulator with XRE-family HTH domain
MNQSNSANPFKMDVDIRKFLNEELQKRKSKNAGLSLRTFAKKIGISHSTLSQILSGKRTLTEKTLKQILAGLNLDSALEQRLLQAFEKNPACFMEVTDQSLMMTNAWYYDAILELTLVQGFQSDEEWIARQLNLSTEECRQAIANLIKTEAFIYGKNGELICNAHKTQKTAGPELVSSIAVINQIQAEFALKEHAAILGRPVEERSSLGLTIAIDPADLPKFRRAAWEFMTQVHELLDHEGANRKEVFRLQLGFFPLTEIANSQK